MQRESKVIRGKTYYKCYAPCCKLFVSGGFCHKHKKQFSQGKPFTGQQYPNPSVLRNQASIIMEQYNHSCAYCGNPAKHIHHKDFGKSDHSLDNLQPLCVICHKRIHSLRQSIKNSSTKDYSYNECYKIAILVNYFKDLDMNFVEFL
jgi:predicted restriction endonuclease